MLIIDQSLKGCAVPYSFNRIVESDMHKRTQQGPSAQHWRSKSSFMPWNAGPWKVSATPVPSLRQVEGNRCGPETQVGFNPSGGYRLGAVLTHFVLGFQASKNSEHTTARQRRGRDERVCERMALASIFPLAWQVEINLIKLKRNEIELKLVFGMLLLSASFDLTFRTDCLGVLFVGKTGSCMSSQKLSHGSLRGTWDTLSLKPFCLLGAPGVHPGLAVS